MRNKVSMYTPAVSPELSLFCTLSVEVEDGSEARQLVPLDSRAYTFKL